MIVVGIGKGCDVLVLPEAVSTDGRGGAVTPEVIGEGHGVPVSTDGCGGAVAPEVIGEGCGVPASPEAVSTDGCGGAVAPEVIGEGRREGEGNSDQSTEGWCLNH